MTDMNDEPSKKEVVKEDSPHAKTMHEAWEIGRQALLGELYDEIRLLQLKVPEAPATKETEGYYDAGKRMAFEIVLDLLTSYQHKE